MMHPFEFLAEQRRQALQLEAERERAAALFNLEKPFHTSVRTVIGLVSIGITLASFGVGLLVGSLLVNALGLVLLSFIALLGSLFMLLSLPVLLTSFIQLRKYFSSTS